MNLQTELIRIETGARLPDALCTLARSREWSSAVCSGIGGVSNVELAYYDLSTRKYLPFPVDGIVELVSLQGNLSTVDGEPFWHLHAVIADREGRCFGGHLNSCVVALTLELAVWPMPESRSRAFDEDLGLRLLINE